MTAGGLPDYANDLFSAATARLLAVRPVGTPRPITTRPGSRLRAPDAGSAPTPDRVTPVTTRRELR
ncbi:hypothetical protein [Streptomyces sp. NPDC050535]|uniref:hypothetical protein n=1 Tax=Streptomyces sp. NPDC050535 TaxID=3365626 RepID=UPI0037932010